MTLVLNSSPPSLSNLIVSDIAPTQTALSKSSIRYLKAMSNVEDPAANIKTREEADKMLGTDNLKVCIQCPLHIHTSFPL